MRSILLAMMVSACGFGDNGRLIESPAVCGDSSLDDGEGCDDGNRTSGDGCSAECAVETADPVCGNAVRETGEACDDGGTAANDGCSTTCTEETLIFSEYVEGISDDKAVELRNTSATALDLELAGCELRLYSNGSVDPSQIRALAGVLAPEAVLVLCNGSADTPILERCDVIANNVVNFNGDDALELHCHGDPIDVIGQVGVDPGSAWGDGDTSTLDRTLRRSCGAIADANGDDAFDATGWAGFEIDAADLGIATCVP